MRLSLITLTASLAVATIAAPVIKRNDDAQDLDIGLGIGATVDKRNEEAEDLDIGVGAVVGIN